MEAPLSERVDAWLHAHREEIIRDLIELVAVPSVSEPGSAVAPFGQPCRDVLDHMLSLGRRHGYETRNYDNYVGAIEFQKGDQTVGFWAHLDVVPVPDPGDWDYPPFEATVVEDRYIIGRGVQDNKSPAIGVFHVMNCLRDLGIPLRHGYTLYLGTNEECGMEDARYFAAHYPCPDLSIVPDSGFPVCCAQRGAMTLSLSVPFVPDVSIEMRNNPSVTPEEITARLPGGETLRMHGKSTHVYNASPEDNAILLLLEALAQRLPEEAEKLRALRTLCAAADGAPLGIAFEDAFSGALLMAPTRMEVTRGRLYVNVFAILPVCCDPDALVQSAKDACARAGVQAEALRLRRLVSFPREHPVVRLLTDTYNEVMHTDSAPFAMSGGNYASCLPKAFGFGPGMPGREFPRHNFREGHGDYHQCDESEDIERLLDFMRVYAAAVVALDALDTLSIEGATHGSKCLP